MIVCLCCVDGDIYTTFLLDLLAMAMHMVPVRVEMCTQFSVSDLALVCGRLCVGSGRQVLCIFKAQCALLPLIVCVRWHEESKVNNKIYA